MRPPRTTEETRRRARVASAVASARRVLDVGAHFEAVTAPGTERVEVLGWSGSDPLPFGDGSFDAIVADVDAALRPRRARLLVECARVLRPGGLFALHDRVPTARGMIVLALKDMIVGRLGDGVIGARPSCTLDGWRALARASGLGLAVLDDLTTPVLKRLDLVRDLVLRFEKTAARDTAVAA